MKIALLIFCTIMLIFGIAYVGIRYQRLAFSPKTLFDLRLRRQLWKSQKTFFWPIWTYGYKKIDSDKYGTVWEIPDYTMHRINELVRSGWPSWRHGERYLESKQRLLEVKDTSTGKKYYLAIPRTEQCSYGHGAVAWTFGLTAEQYQPAMET